MSKPLLPLDAKTAELVKNLLRPIWLGRFKHECRVDVIEGNKLDIDRGHFIVSIEDREHSNGLVPLTLGPQYILERATLIPGGREEPDDVDYEEMDSYSSLQALCQDIVLHIWSTYANDEMHAFYFTNDL